MSVVNLIDVRTVLGLRCSCPRVDRNPWWVWAPRAIKQAPSELCINPDRCNPLVVSHADRRIRPEVHPLPCVSQCKAVPQQQKRQGGKEREAARLRALRRPVGGEVANGAHVFMATSQGVNRSKIATMCGDCDVFLCLPRDDSGSCCWELWHTLSNLEGVRV